MKIAAKKFGRSFPGLVIEGRPEAARRDDEIASVQRLLEAGCESASLIAQGRLSGDTVTFFKKMAADKGGIGIDDGPFEELIANGNHFDLHGLPWNKSEYLLF